MEQPRPLRLGDIVDDYCPRERRLTNHAIVAIVEETIKQTRCTTCDHEHVYKQAREPRRRKKDDTSALYSQVLSGLQKPAAPTFSEESDSVDDTPETPGASAPPPMAEPAAAAAPPAAAAPAVADPAVVEPAQGSAAAEAAEDEDEADGNVADGSDEPWPMHRRLIRAQLPRTGNEPPPARPLPEFTVRQPGARGGQRQWGRGGAGANGNGGHAHRGGQGQGQGGGQG
ncbi:MAG TPA: hypothetical protein VMN81_11210, partial [Vicinamibacterales bacterium]|nr:hypothetical protein [Vicinamibacterales bacterium]